MAKYKRNQSRSITLNSTSLGWGLLILIVLLTVTFFLGMYFGYSQGFESAENTFKTADKTSGSLSKRKKEKKDTSEATKETKNKKSDDQSTDENKSVITQGDIGFTEDDEESQKSSSSKSNESTTNQNQEVTSGAQSSEEQQSTNREAKQEVESDGIRYIIQISSSQKKKNSKRVRDKLKEEGHNASISEATVNGDLYYRVRVGEFNTRNRASQYAEQMKNKGHIEDYWISQIQ